MKELYERFKDQGLVLIGVHTEKGQENMADYVEKEGIPYPVAIDTEGKTVDAFAVDSFPDYYVIDRSGRVRAADLANAELDRVIEILLKEQPEDMEQAPADDIRRERQGEFGPAQDRLEGRVAPALRVSDWMNTSGS
ncbi:peroxiredoxin family protein, partial [Gemmatimonadota bacterium]